MTDECKPDAEAIAALDAWNGFKVPWGMTMQRQIGMTMQRQMRRALDAASAWRKTQADALPWPDTYPMPAHGWTCFHCGETFTTPGSARDHFGCEPCADPACRIKVGEERGLVMALRKAEKELARYRVEDSDADRRYYAQQADHAQALIREEEKGYARGMADFREHELPKAVETALTARAQPALGLADDARKIAEVGKLRKALEPFATFGICDDGEDIRDGLMRDRIVDWFGLGDFNAARVALAMAAETALTARAQPASGLADDARKIVDALVFIKARTNRIAERTQEFLSHDNACAAVKLAAATLPLAESLPGKIEDLERERGRLRDVIERDRTKTAEVISTARGVLASRAWLAEGRGSYEFDDEKYQEEFGAAITEILVALDPLRALAADWSDCPKDYRGARIDWKARAEAAESQLAKRDAEVGKLRAVLKLAGDGA